MLLCIFKTGVYSLIDNGDSAQQIYSRTKPFSTHLISFFSTRRTSLAFGYRFERWFCLIFHRFAFYVTVRTFELFFFLFSLRHSYIKCRSTAKTKLASLLAHRLETFHFKFPPYKSRVPACLSRSKVFIRSLFLTRSLCYFQDHINIQSAYYIHRSSYIARQSRQQPWTSYWNTYGLKQIRHQLRHVRQFSKQRTHPSL